MLSEAHANGVGFFDKLVPACGPGFAAALRCVTRVIVYLSGACPDKYIFNSLRRSMGKEKRLPCVKEGGASVPDKIIDFVGHF